MRQSSWHHIKTKSISRLRVGHASANATNPTRPIMISRAFWLRPSRFAASPTTHSSSTTPSPTTAGFTPTRLLTALFVIHLLACFSAITASAPSYSNSAASASPCGSHFSRQRRRDRDILEDLGYLQLHSGRPPGAPGALTAAPYGYAASATGSAGSGIRDAGLHLQAHIHRHDQRTRFHPHHAYDRASHGHVNGVHVSTPNNIRANYSPAAFVAPPAYAPDQQHYRYRTHAIPPGKLAPGMRNPKSLVYGAVARNGPVPPPKHRHARHLSLRGSTRRRNAGGNQGGTGSGAGMGVIRRHML
ncbi:hypothetical protein BDZ91DRAFT_744745 [Kalaharituber pfeilii]|nr:hypothetical protein BDZ91DRAFT_744745 [Kalaharituber pfeilii]